MPPNLQPQIFSNTLDIVTPYKGVLLDAYGVFWGGNRSGVIADSKERMENLVASGKIVGVLSNSTQRSVNEINKLQKHGLIQGEHFHFYITSGEIACDTFSKGTLPFKTPKKSFWIFGGIHPSFSSPLSLFEGSPYQEVQEVSDADFIYISIPHRNGEDQLDEQVFLDAIKELKNSNLPMVCANPDRFAHEGLPPKAVARQGSIAKLYEELGGEVFYIGKPYPAVYDVAMDYFAENGVFNPRDILMIGDTPETDIRGANDFKMSSALVTTTGVMGDRVKDQNLSEIISHLPLGDHPNFYIERF